MTRQSAPAWLSKLVRRAAHRGEPSVEEDNEDLAASLVACSGVPLNLPEPTHYNYPTNIESVVCRDFGRQAWWCSSTTRPILRDGSATGPIGYISFIQTCKTLDPRI